MKVIYMISRPGLWVVVATWFGYGVHHDVTTGPVGSVVDISVTHCYLIVIDKIAVLVGVILVASFVSFCLVVEV